MASGLNVQDRQWQRESDARTLAEAKIIETTPTRLKGATTEAKKMAKQSTQQAKAMTKVANRSKPVSRSKRSKPVTRSNKKTPLTRAAKKRK